MNKFQIKLKSFTNQPNLLQTNDEYSMGKQKTQKQMKFLIILIKTWESDVVLEVF
jgi:hypothetical protein